jgi:hypothetical protein
MGINVLGGRLDYRFPAAAFYNTEYHLECGYPRERTAILANRLLSIAARQPHHNRHRDGRDHASEGLHPAM